MLVPLLIPFDALALSVLAWHWKGLEGKIARPPPPHKRIKVNRDRQKISFGGIPNSSSIDILMPYAIFDYMGAFLGSSFAYVDNVIPVIIRLLLSRLQANKPHRNPPEPSEPCLRNLHQHAPELSRTLQNLPEPTFRNLPEPTS